MSVLIVAENNISCVFNFTVLVLSAYFTVLLIPTNLELSLSDVIDVNIHSSTVSNVLMVVDQSSIGSTQSIIHIKMINNAYGYSEIVKSSSNHILQPLACKQRVAR
jgi:hypothetical protein